MAATTNAPSTEDLKSTMRIRTTGQLIRDHALADAMTGGENRDVTAWVLVCSAIEAVLKERGVATCPDCGTPSEQHADFCRAGA